MMFRFDVATELSGLNKSEPFGGNIVLGPAVRDFVPKVNKLGGLPITLGGGISSDTFGRLLAKIGHAFAVAEIGLDHFVPLLTSVIVGAGPYDIDLNKYVGSGLADDGPSNNQHEVELIKRKNYQGEALLVARIRLFSAQNMPTHYVVVGRLL
jgi:hypothetical protein